MFTLTHFPFPGHRPTGPDDLYAVKPAWDIDNPRPTFPRASRRRCDHGSRPESPMRHRGQSAVVEITVGPDRAAARLVEWQGGEENACAAS